MNRSIALALAALCALPLSACIDSAGPILTDSKPLFGQYLRLQLYSLHDGRASDPEQNTYSWNGSQYIKAGGGTHDVAAFSAHPFEGSDYIVESVPSDKSQNSEYAVVHRLADGVYLLVAIDEADADDATRAADCKRVDRSACRIATREQLFAFARATAAKHKDQGGLVLRLPDAADK